MVSSKACFSIRVVLVKVIACACACDMSHVTRTRVLGTADVFFAEVLAVIIGVIVGTAAVAEAGFGIVVYRDYVHRIRTQPYECEHMRREVHIRADICIDMI